MMSNLDPLNSLEARFLFWLVRPVHLYLIRLFFGKLNKIRPIDARIDALMYCCMISIKYPKLKFTLVMGGIAVGGFLGMFLISPMLGHGRFYICLGGFIGASPPYLLWGIIDTLHARKFVTECLEDLEYQECPICGWYFNKEVACICNEEEVNK